MQIKLTKRKYEQHILQSPIFLPSFHFARFYVRQVVQTLAKVFWKFRGAKVNEKNRNFCIIFTLEVK